MTTRYDYEDYMTKPELKIVPTIDISTKKEEYKIHELTSAKRYAIKINEITAEKNSYSRKSTMVSKQLINNPTESIGFFCSEYIPNHFPSKKYISYILNVNGIDYNVEPINSHRPGKKIIKSSIEAHRDNSIYIGEQIREAYLKITIETPNSNETPFISNIKILKRNGGLYEI